jgi:hypothetical protein
MGSSIIKRWFGDPNPYVGGVLILSGTPHGRRDWSLDNI